MQTTLLEETFAMTETNSYSITNWEETPVEALPGPLKFTTARVTRRHDGVLRGIETMHYTLMYSNEQRSEFIGIGQIEGELDGHKGRFALFESGKFDQGIVTGTFDLRVLCQHSDLASSIGLASYQSGMAETVSYSLEVSKNFLTRLSDQS